MQPSAAPLSAAAIEEQEGWAVISRGEMPAAFEGDAVVSNGRILVVARKEDPAVELYSLGSGAAVLRARLLLLAEDGDPAARLERAALVESTRGAASLEVVYGSDEHPAIGAKLRIKRGEIAVETTPGAGAGRLRVECPARFVLLPDFFADDILIDACAVKPDSIELPSENFLLHLTGGGDAIAMCVFENSEQEVRTFLGGEGEARAATASEIRFAEERKIWVALMESPGIWHARAIEPADAGRVLPLGWKAPFVAEWRVDFTRDSELTDSWEMLVPDEKGSGYLKPSWLPAGPEGNPPSRTSTGEIDVRAYQSGGPASARLGDDRKRWTTVIGWFEYPCWSDREGMGYLQPLKHKKIAFRGPAVIYPINRLAGTPIETYTVVDIVRNTLGVGPCQYILDVENQRQEHVGRATCHVRSLLDEIYKKGQQKAKREEIDEYLDDGLAFVTHIRGRIDQYVEFGREVRKYIEKQKAVHPELAEFLAEMNGLAAEFDERIGARRELIKTPGFVARMNDDFREKLIDDTSPDVLAKLKAYTDALTRLGGNQDELVGECRWIARTLRQRAGIRMATDPACAPVAEAIREMARKALLKPSAYEAARH
ncbi:MAG: hypothetical protein JXA90_06095 [Planctomycetes bacterium]|nr:hypothetical protein [Planctomycetota bacterium]